MKRFRPASPKKFYGIVALIAMGGGVAVTLLWINRPVILPRVANQATFVVFYPARSSAAQVDEGTVKYDRSIGQLSYVARYEGQDLTFAQQAAPDQFRDIPEYYGKFVDQLKGYTSFENSLGRVDITRPQSGGKQAAVMVNRGTLMFVQASKDMDAETWKRLFNSVTYVQPK